MPPGPDVEGVNDGPPGAAGEGARDVPMVVRIHDVSLGGCLIEASVPIEIGRRLTLRLDVPGDEPITIAGEAVRFQGGFRYAVQFIEMDDDTCGRLERALDRMMQLPGSGRQPLGGAAMVE